MACSQVVENDDIKVTTEEYPRWILCGKCIAEILGLENKEEVFRFLLPEKDPRTISEEELKVSVDILAEKVIASDTFSMRQKEVIMIIADTMIDDCDYISEWIKIVYFNDEKTIEERTGASSIEEILKRLSANE